MNRPILSHSVKGVGWCRVCHISSYTCAHARLYSNTGNPTRPYTISGRDGAGQAAATIREAIARWPAELREAWEERAAIIEHDGGETREIAERLAFECYREEAGR